MADGYPDEYSARTKGAPWNEPEGAEPDTDGLVAHEVSYGGDRTLVRFGEPCSLLQWWSPFSEKWFPLDDADATAKIAVQLAERLEKSQAQVARLAARLAAVEQNNMNKENAHV